MVVSVHDKIKQKLGIKYADAKRLLDEAKESLGIEGVVDPENEDEVIQEACDIFEDLDPEEQAEMRIPAAPEEPEWKRRATEQAERREREWETEEQKRQEAEARRIEEAKQKEREKEIEEIAAARRPKRKVKTEVTVVKTVNGQEEKEVKYEEREVGDPTSVKTVYCCSIL